MCHSELSAETSISITAGTNLGVSTLGAITAAIRHYRQKNHESSSYNTVYMIWYVAEIDKYAIYLPIALKMINSFGFKDKFWAVHYLHYVNHLYQEDIIFHQYLYSDSVEWQ